MWLFYLDENLSRAAAAGRTTGSATSAWPRWPRSRSVYLFAVARAAPGAAGAGRPAAPVVRAWVGAAGRCWALCALQVPGAGYHALTCVVYIAAAAMVGLPIKQAVPFAAVLVVGTELLSRLVPGWEDNGYGLAVLLGAAGHLGHPAGHANASTGCRGAGRSSPRMAVQNERARIAADLHDILGHSLTVVTVKAELAQRLLDVDLETGPRRTARPGGPGPRRARRRARHRARACAGSRCRARSPPPARPWPRRTSRPTCPARPTRCRPGCGSCSPGPSGRR